MLPFAFLRIKHHTKQANIAPYTALSSLWLKRGEHPYTLVEHQQRHHIKHVPHTNSKLLICKGGTLLLTLQILQRYKIVLTLITPTIIRTISMKIMSKLNTVYLLKTGAVVRWRSPVIKRFGAFHNALKGCAGWGDQTQPRNQLANKLIIYIYTSNTYLCKQLWKWVNKTFTKDHYGWPF